MTITANVVPFEQVFGLDGKPLDNGKIYIGTPNQDPQYNQVQVYWDEAGTITASQPIRTVAGYISYNGAPARIYANGNYSLKVLTKNDVQVYYVPDYLMIGTQDALTPLTGLAQFANYAALRAYNGAATTVYVAGRTNDQDGAAGAFSVDESDTTSADNDGTILVDALGRRWKRQYSATVNAKWFGAVGDGLGRTPSDVGQDISNEPWNTWDGTPFKTDTAYSPYYVGGVFTPPRPKPFLNTDTLDYIGISKAVWFAAPKRKRTLIPAGEYKINVGSVSLMLMRGMESSIVGEGIGVTKITTLENAAYFDANRVGVDNAYKLVSLYRVGGPPTTLNGLTLEGPINYSVTAKNLTLLACENINGVSLSDLWLSTACRGVRGVNNSGDSHIQRVTAEYCFSSAIYTDLTSEFDVDYVNLWASANVTGQKGVEAVGAAAISNSKFIGFTGGAVKASSGRFVGNFVFSTFSSAYDVQFTNECTITGNTFDTSSVIAQLNVVNFSTVTGNTFKNSSNHACINIGDGNTCNNISITGNEFLKSDSSIADFNFAIIAEKSGSNYTGAANQSVIIEGNNFVGSALQELNGARIRGNTFNGVRQATVALEEITAKNTVNLHADVLGKRIMDGSGTGNPLAVTLTGLLGQGQGDERAQQRLNLVSIQTTGIGHVGQGFALYTSSFNGNAALIATLGTNVTGGSITFGVSGANPTVSITNGGGVIAYKVNAVPLI